MKKLLSLLALVILGVSNSFAQSDEYRFVIMGPNNTLMVSLAFDSNTMSLTRRMTLLASGEVVENKTYTVSSLAYFPEHGIVFYTKDNGKEEVCAQVNSNASGSDAFFNFGAGEKGIRSTHSGGPHEKFAATFQRLRKAIEAASGSGASSSVGSASQSSRGQSSSGAAGAAHVESQTLAQFIDNPMGLSATGSDGLSYLTTRLRQAGWNSKQWNNLAYIHVDTAGKFSMNGIKAEYVQITRLSDKLVFKFWAQFETGDKGLQAVVVQFLQIMDKLKELGYTNTKSQSDWDEHPKTKRLALYPEDRTYEAPGKRKVTVQIQTDCHADIPRSKWRYHIIVYVTLPGRE